MQDRAQTVVVGAGIVGASAAYHLAELGATDVLVIDRGPLFATGGSTSHAPGLVFQTNGSRTMCRLAQYTTELYGSLTFEREPGWYPCGGLEVATTPARMEELKRRQGFARSYGIEGTELLTPSECAARIPLLNPGHILGGYLVPTDGIAKAVHIVEALALAASTNGVAFEGGVTVTGFDIREGRVREVLTDRGAIACERVLICAGIWGPIVGAMAGVPIPLVAVQHQLVWTEPVPELVGETREVIHPILRHQDASLYYRHRRDHYAVGNYRHQPIVTPQTALRGPGATMSFTPEDFEVAERETELLMPALRGRMHPADPARSLNGMFSFTPDGGSIVGESSKVRGVWVCEAVWVTQGGGMGRMVAEWMAGGEPSMDLAEADVNRFYPFMTSAPYVRARGEQQYREVYDILHPLQQMSSPRNLRLDAVARPPRGAGRRLLHGRRVGATAVVRGQPRARGRCRARVGAAHGLGGAALVADRGGRAPRHPRGSGAVRHHVVREVRRLGPRCAVLPGARLREPHRPAGGCGDLHRGAHPPRRDPARPHGDPQGRGAVPRRDGRWERSARPRVAARAGRRGRASHDHRADGVAVRAGPVGAPRPRHPVGGHRRRRLERRLSLPERAVPRRRRGVARVGAAYLLRGRAGLGTVRPVRDGRARLGPPVGGRARPRSHRGRRRRVRLAAAGEGLPAVGAGHRHGARPARGGARIRGPLGQGLPGQGGAGTDPRGRRALPAARVHDVRRSPRGCHGQGADQPRRAGRELRDVGGLRLLRGPRHRLRLSAERPGGGGHGGAGGVLRGASRRHRARTNPCGIPRANG